MQRNPIEVMQLGIKFNKLSEDTRKIVCESFQIEHSENKNETNQKFVRKLYELKDEDIKTIESIFEEELKQYKEENEIKKEKDIIKIEKTHKRNYNEYIKESKIKSQETKKEKKPDKNEILQDAQNINLLKKSRTKKSYPKYLKEKEHYFYIDNNNNEWCFTEINGTKENYYFKCSTHICKGFGKLKRNKNELNNENQFTLTKEHTIPYEEHNYYKDTVIPKKLQQGNLTKKDWQDKNIRINMFRNYFKENKAASIMQCVEYIKGRFGNDLDINEDIKKEINSAKFVVNINN